MVADLQRGKWKVNFSNPQHWWEGVFTRFILGTSGIKNKNQNFHFENMGNGRMKRI